MAVKKESSKTAIRYAHSDAQKTRAPLHGVMCMKAKGQYTSSVILGVSSSVLLWYFLVTSAQLFTKSSFWVLVPPILSGVVGGAFVFYFAPEHKSKLTLNRGLSCCGTNAIFSIQKWF